LGSSKTSEAGVDTKLEEGEGSALCRGELEEEAGSPKSGRYGLSWVLIGDDGRSMRAACPSKQAFVVGKKTRFNVDGSSFGGGKSMSGRDPASNCYNCVNGS